MSLTARDEAQQARYGPSVAYPTVAAESVAWITETQMIEVDRVMVEDLDIGLIQMMENAGRNLARATIDLFDPQRVWVAAGSGGNGGGGLVAARHLANAGVDVRVTTTKPAAELTGVPARQLGILERMGIAVGGAPAPDEIDVGIDALIGYSLHGAPHGRTETLIRHINRCGRAIALDTPSGLDVTSGETPGAVVDATSTLTLALPKVGLRGSRCVGQLLLADISVPPSVTGPLGGAPGFRAGSIVEVRHTDG